jgi:hypothetical protein
MHSRNPTNCKINPDIMIATVKQTDESSGNPSRYVELEDLGFHDVVYRVKGALGPMGEFIECLIPKYPIRCLQPEHRGAFLPSSPVPLEDFFDYASLYWKARNMPAHNNKVPVKVR